MAGLLLTVVARTFSSGAALPVTMVGIPILFYVVLALSGCSLDCARDSGWVGSANEADDGSRTETSLWSMIDMSLVHWSLIGDLLWIWIGMVFVVSFASCLDVAAISMDMGEPLDTNKELATVGVCNLMSGLTGGYSGSYIFSQTIFTFRTGVHSRWIGGFLMMFFAAVVASPVNILQISPLFFFGSTLIFIGFDLLYEWFYEIRSTLSLAEYGTIWGTFFAIQVLGIDFGILVGVLVAVVEHVTVNAQTTAVHRVGKRSRAAWTPEEFKVLNDHAYNSISPKIMTLEVSGPCFFGSSVALLQNMVGELGIDSDQSDIRGEASFIRSPHASASALRRKPPDSLSQNQSTFFGTSIQRPPQFCVLDLAQVSNIDASAARSCFQTLSKMAIKKGISIFACGASPRVDWMLRSHGASYETDEAEKAMERLRRQTRDVLRLSEHPADKIIMFLTSYEALEFSESLLINEIHYNGMKMVSTNFGPKEQTLSSILSRLIEANDHEEELLLKFDHTQYHDLVYFSSGERIFTKDSKPEAFYVVLQGNIASGKARKNIVYRNRQEIVTGAGFISKKRTGSLSDLLDPSLTDVPAEIATVYPVGGIFGYTDVLLGRPRSFEAFATKQSKVARITKRHLQSLHREDPVLNGLLHRALVKVSVLDLANCTCDDV